MIPGDVTEVFPFFSNAGTHILSNERNDIMIRPASVFTHGSRHPSKRSESETFCVRLKAHDCVVFCFFGLHCLQLCPKIHRDAVFLFISGSHQVHSSNSFSNCLITVSNFFRRFFSLRRRFSKCEGFWIAVSVSGLGRYFTTS